MLKWAYPPLNAIALFKSHLKLLLVHSSDQIYPSWLSIADITVNIAQLILAITQVHGFISSR